MKKHFFPADVLLPKKNHEKWAVIACDQYTSEPEYWDKVRQTVGDSASALNIILPEVYLKPDNSKMTEKINRTMNEYLENGIFDEYKNTYVLTRRTLNNGEKRVGVVGLIDLEDYSYQSGADTLIRATEKTVLERIPPRVEIRRDAVIEIPHIMLLIDDPDETVIEPLNEKASEFEKLYGFELMQNAGSIEGFAISEAAADNMNSALNSLYEKSGGLLFAVGDGNHSLATAKECYEQGKGSRYAMVEVVNIHDRSLNFEPIYRVVFGIDPLTLLNDFISYSEQNKGTVKHSYTCIFGKNEKEISVFAETQLAVAGLQTFLDEYKLRHPEMTVDYIHGEENLKKICLRENALGFLFDGMGKQELFKAVKADGSLPRKTFSMGHADDKRFYLEARKI